MGHRPSGPPADLAKERVKEFATALPRFLYPCLLCLAPSSYASRHPAQVHGRMRVLPPFRLDNVQCSGMESTLISVSGQSTHSGARTQGAARMLGGWVGLFQLSRTAEAELASVQPVRPAWLQHSGKVGWFASGTHSG